MYTISQIAKKFNLSRTTLLYYESINLFEPSEVSDNNYRLYSEKDCVLLNKICMFRDMGIPLKKIKIIIENDSDKTSKILEEQLSTLNKQIIQLRNQQNTILKLLQNETLRKSVFPITKKDWINILSSTGLSDEDMENWHREFEHNSPEGHQNFLESLGINPSEIQNIRKRSK